jgi:hypothetical protein
MTPPPISGQPVHGKGSSQNVRIIYSVDDDEEKSLSTVQTCHAPRTWT